MVIDEFEGDVEFNYDELGRSVFLHPLVLAGLAIALFFLGFVAFLFSADQLERREAGSNESADPAASATTAATTDTSDNSDTSDGSEEAAATATTEAPVGQAPAPTDTPEGAFVEATLNLDAGPGPGLFKLSGRVPDAETANALIAAAELSYAPYVESDLEVDETLEPAPWLATSPQLIGLLPSVTDGTIRVADEKVQLFARSPNPQYLAQLEGALTQLGELPVEVSETLITELTPPRFVAALDDGKITLSGEVPSDDVRQLLAGGAAAAYGPENVINELTIDDGTYTSFWMYTMPGIFQLFSPFPHYDIQVVDGVSSGSLQGGLSFDVDSTTITEEASQVLNIGVAIMARDLSIFMTVEGHTDSSGPDEYNMALSEGRAQSVTAYFEAAGINAARLIAIGVGESEPMVSNDTPEGKAQNRRVEFLFGPPPSG